jgi:pimeloyl-ACP methyl ester carboxylesterase
MHFLQYPGNVEGDVPINGATRSDYVARRSDGKHMRGMKLPITSANTSKQAPVIFFGGNGQGMSGAALDAEILLRNIITATSAFQFQAFTTAYRGYAPNSGWVTQTGLTNDAMDFLDHALNSTHGSQDGRVILAGWSMGAGVAMQLAAARPDKIAGLIVFSPWSTLRTESLNFAGGIAHLVWPWIWMSEIWDSVTAVSSLPAEIPVAVISAGQDSVIPNWEHRKVFDASMASHKWWIPTPLAGHPDLNLEVTQNIDPVSQWMNASWGRVQVYSKSKGNAPDLHAELPSLGGFPSESGVAIA